MVVAPDDGGRAVAGIEHIPATGPVVILANHPGMTDTVALLASLASRPDLLVIALDRPFLRALANVAKQLIFVADEDASRMSVVRAVAKHLKQGGALLTFPAGDIEPDPATFGRRRAVESVGRWSDSFALFARLAPLTRFVPAIVSHVISPQARRHGLTRLRRTAQNKGRLCSGPAGGPAALSKAGRAGRVRAFATGLCFRPGLSAVCDRRPGTPLD